MLALLPAAKAAKSITKKLCHLVWLHTITAVGQKYGQINLNRNF
jgi:hypothetical protein